MNIFSPYLLSRYDNFKENVGIRRRNLNMAKVKVNAGNKFRSSMIGIFKPTAVVLLTLAGLHFYNQAIEKEWADLDVNLYEKSKSYYRAARWEIIKNALWHRVDSKLPLEHFLSSLNRENKQLRSPILTKPKVLERHSSTRINAGIFRWKTLSKVRMINEQGDLVEVHHDIPLQVLGLNLTGSSRTVLLRRLRKIKNVRSWMFGHFEVTEDKIGISAFMEKLLRVYGWFGPYDEQTRDAYLLRAQQVEASLFELYERSQQEQEKQQAIDKAEQEARA